MSTKADTTGLEYLSPEWFEACAAIKRGHLAGKVVQYQSKLSRADWMPTDPAWHPNCDYRLAPEPREVWVRFGSTGEPIKYIYARKPGNDGRYIKFREVIE